MSDRTPIDAVRSNREAFDAALSALGCTVKGRSASCPWHDDQNPSASILQAAGGAWRLHCHVCARGGDVFDLRETAGGPSVADQLRALRSDDTQASARPHMQTTRSPEPSRLKPVFPDLDTLAVSLQGMGTLEATYEYTDPDSRAIDLAVFRIIGADGNKRFMQASPRPGGWVLEGAPKPWPLFNRRRVRAALVVVVCEGEKCVAALKQIDIVATTSPAGAGKAALADWSPLAGKRVILWPDNDATGLAHMVDVRRVLEGLANPPTLALIDPATLGLPEKGDAADIVVKHGSDPAARAAVDAILAGAVPLGASEDVGRLLEATIAGTRRAIAWPWARLTELARALQPGTITLLCGDPGSGKSFWLLEAAAYLHEHGESVALLELEEDRAHHLHRALAQRAGNSSLADLDWIAGHPAEARQVFEAHRRFMDGFGPRLHESRATPTMREVADWIEARARGGCRIVMVDPLSIAQGTDKPWQEDREFILRIANVARDTGVSVILSVHPRKGLSGRPQGIDDVAGGAALGRFAQTVLWLEKLPSMRPHSIGGHSADCNRVVSIMKARNGPGSGIRLGFVHEAHSLRFAEVGVIETGPKPKPTGQVYQRPDHKAAAAGGGT